MRSDRPVALQVDGEYVGEQETVRFRSVPPRPAGDSVTCPSVQQTPGNWWPIKPIYMLKMVHLGIAPARCIRARPAFGAPNVTDQTPKSVRTFAKASCG